MKQNNTSFDQLPLMLNATNISQTLGISRAGAYELMHRKDFPTLRIGKRMIVSKEYFVRWIEANSGRSGVGERRKSLYAEMER